MLPLLAPPHLGFSIFTFQGLGCDDGVRPVVLDNGFVEEGGRTL